MEILGSLVSKENFSAIHLLACISVRCSLTVMMLFTVARSRKYRYIELALEKELLELFFGQEASAVVVLEQ